MGTERVSKNMGIGTPADASYPGVLFDHLLDASDAQPFSVAVQEQGGWFLLRWLAVLVETEVRP
jgi:hypothetical protein